VSYWRALILLGIGETGDADVFRRDLMWMFTGMYSSKRRGSAHFKIREAIQQRLITLPESIYSFLYAQQPHEPVPFFGKHPLRFLKLPFLSARKSMNAWIRMKTGREKQDYLASLDEVLAFMEAYMEMKHDNTATGIGLH
jgi:hypothetical protein